MRAWNSASALASVQSPAIASRRPSRLRVKLGEPIRFAVDRRDTRAFGKEPPRRRRSDAMRGAGDDDGLAEKTPRVHFGLSQ